MRKASNEPRISDSARWLGMPTEPEPVHEWGGLDEQLAAMGGDARQRFYVQSLYMRTIGVTFTRDVVERMLAEAVEWGQSRQQRASKPSPTEATVYYLRVGALIKIGQTVRPLSARLGQYPPDSVLLATETGPVDELEAERLWQFRNDQALGARRREWFNPSAALIAHINSLREQPLSPADLAA